MRRLPPHWKLQVSADSRARRSVLRRRRDQRVVGMVARRHVLPETAAGHNSDVRSFAMEVASA